MKTYKQINGLLSYEWMAEAKSHWETKFGGSAFLLLEVVVK